jgi:hypothetical protein
MAGYVGGSAPVDVARLRRMTAEPQQTPYTDAMLVEAIERYPVPDLDDFWPDEAGWLPSYDLAMAAAEIWSEKATLLATNFDFDADGANFSRSQQYDHFMKQARHWRALRQPGNYTVITPIPDGGSAQDAFSYQRDLDFSDAGQSGYLAAF